MKRQIVVVVTIIGAFFLSLSAISVSALAIEIAPRITDREIVESLAEIKKEVKSLETKIDESIKRLEEGQNSILREMDKRFEAMDTRLEDMNKTMDKRFEAMDKRFEAMDKRFEDVNKHLEHLTSIFIGIVCAFAGIVAVTIAFAMWDRVTAMRPALKKSGELEKREERVEEALKGFAEKEPRLHEILRRVGIL